MKFKNINEFTDIEPLDKLKIELDYERIRIENKKIWITAGAFVFPVIVSLILGYFSYKNSITLENERAKANFEIKAAEIVMNASSPLAATNKAVVLSELFPDRLPKDFKNKMQRMYGNIK